MKSKSVTKNRSSVNPEHGTRKITRLKSEPAGAPQPDIENQHTADEVLKSSLKIHQLMSISSVDEIIQFGLEESVRLTTSKIGYFHFVNPDQKTISLQTWSENTLKTCTAAEKGMHYPIDKAGIWVDCIHQRKPVIHNNYESLSHKKGLPEGHVKVIRDLAVPVFESGKIVAVIGVGNKTSDYTEFDLDQVSLLAENTWSIVQRKRAMEHLIESEEKHRRIFECIQDGYYETGINGTIIEVSPSFEMLFGYKREELIGNSALDLYPQPERRKQLVKKIRKIGWINDFEISLTAKNGNEIPCSITSRIITSKDGRPIKIIGTIRDITERKQAEEALLKEKAFTDTVMNSMPGIVYVYDENYQLIKWNINHETSTGFSSNELLRMNPTGFFDDEEKDKIIAATDKVYDTGEAAIEADLVNKDGTKTPHYFTGKRIIKDDKKYMLGVGIDITARKLAEAEREKLIADLQKALKEVKTLGGLLPICSYCKNVRDDQGYWTQVEAYVSEHSGAEFTHGICPDCLEEQRVIIRQKQADDQDQS
ncbi:MAG: PAS domain S-box protein [candidate division Zixibacteria bacterium]|nr:PAS domain S-box protein [candidate division Zixibacteria bacterium]